MSLSGCAKITLTGPFDMRPVIRHLKHECIDFYNCRYPLTSQIVLILAACYLMEVLVFGLVPSSSALYHLGGVVNDQPLAWADWWRFIASNFIHTSLLHYASVVIGLWYMSGRLERIIGWRWLLPVVLAGCVGSTIAGNLYGPNQLVQVGGSGIVAAACGAGLVVDSKAKHQLGKMARWFFISFIIYALGVHDYSTSAHAGGIIAGVIVGGLYLVARAMAKNLADQAILKE